MNGLSREPQRLALDAAVDQRPAAPHLAAPRAAVDHAEARMKAMAIQGRVRGQRITVVREIVIVCSFCLGVPLVAIVFALMCAYGWST